jgi:MFS transporter, DHA1 family, tetracycline resistance protein
VRETKLMFTTTIVLMFALIGWGFAKSIWQYILLIIPIAISAGIFNVSLTSLLTKSIYRENVGGTLGLAQSQQTFAQVITPLMGGPLIQYFGGYAVGLTAAFFLGISAMIEKKQLLGMPEAQGPCSRAEAVNKT